MQQMQRFLFAHIQSQKNYFIIKQNQANIGCYGYFPPNKSVAILLSCKLAGTPPPCYNYKSRKPPRNLNLKNKTYYLSNPYVGGIRGKYLVTNAVGAVHQQHGVHDKSEGKVHDHCPISLTDILHSQNVVCNGRLTVQYASLWRRIWFSSRVHYILIILAEIINSQFAPLRAYQLPHTNGFFCYTEMAERSLKFSLAGWWCRVVGKMAPALSSAHFTAHDPSSSTLIGRQ